MTANMNEKETEFFFYQTAEGQVTITKYKDTGSVAEIPSVVEEMPVTVLGDYASRQCEENRPVRFLQLPQSEETVFRQQIYGYGKRCVYRMSSDQLSGSEYGGRRKRLKRNPVRGSRRNGSAYGWNLQSCFVVSGVLRGRCGKYTGPYPHDACAWQRYLLSKLFSGKEI